MLKKIDKNANRKARHSRVRKKISGSSELPRLNVFRSGKHIYAQIIDDVQGTTFYGQTFASAVSRENVYGVQFHPEKSHRNGIQLLHNFAKI